MNLIPGINVRFFLFLIITLSSASLSAQIISNSPVCVGGTLNLNSAQAGNNYAWSGPNSFASNQRNPTIPSVTLAANGVYTLIVDGVSYTANVQVLSPPPTPIITTKPTFCDSVNLILTTSNGGSNSFNWSGPNFSSPQSSPVIPFATAANAGVYSVYYTNAACTSATASITLSVRPSPAKPTITGTANYCQGDTIRLSMTPTGTVTTYSWITPAGNANSKNFQLNNVNSGQSGTYEASYSDGVCQSKIATINIIVSVAPGQPNIDVITGPLLCENDTLVLGAGSGIPTDTTFWTGPNGFTSKLTYMYINKVVMADSGYYKARIMRGGCYSIADSIKISIKKTPRPLKLYTNAPICAFTQLIVKTDSIEPGVTYVWYDPLGNQHSDSVFVLKPEYDMDGDYLVTASGGGCTSEKDTINVHLKERIPHNWTTDTFEPYVSDYSPCEFYRWQWQMPIFEDAVYWWRKDISGVDSILTRDRQFVVDSVEMSYTGNYRLIAQNTCDSAVYAHHIDVIKSPRIYVLGDTGICDYEVKDLVLESTQPVIYEWDNGVTSERRTIDSPGIYRALATNYQACTTRTAFQVDLLCHPEIFVPNAFTPNGDNINDLFKVSAHNLDAYKFEVYARTGRRVWVSLSPDDWWDGTYSGEKLPPGQYFYNIYYKKNFQYSIYEDLKEGTIQIIR